MMFVARQLVEKMWECNDALFMLFVDPRKVYSAQKGPVLVKCGVSPVMLKVINDGMCAEVRVGGSITERFQVRIEMSL